MKLDSRQTIHIGINFILSPAPVLNKRAALQFQAELDDLGITITHVQQTEQLQLIRQPNMPLQITVGVVGPPAGQLLVVAPEPGRHLDSVAIEIEDVIKAFYRAWPAPARQILRVDAAIRDLYDTSSEHAFKELWETRLRQTGDSLQTLGPSLVGGGLRFVLPPTMQDHMAPLTEVKIESYLQNPRKLFLEAQFIWEQPAPPNVELQATERLEQLDNYISTQVVGFVQEGQ